MKKNILIILVVLIVIITLNIGVISFNNNKNIDIDIRKLADDLKNAQIFEDNLSQIDRSSIIKKYEFDNNPITEIISYLGTGATAEEILIMEVSDEKYVKEIEEKIKSKMEENKINFQNYLPKEVYKLENYILESKGKYIVLCVSNDYDKTKEIINKYFNN